MASLSSSSSSSSSVSSAASPAAAAWFEAVRTGAPEALEALLVADSMLLNLVKDTQTPYAELVAHQAEILLGANTRRMNALHLAITHLRPSAVIFFLIEEDDSPYYINARWGDDNTALHLAALLGMTAVARELVRLGADPHAKNHKGLSPIDLAHEEDMKRVLAGGAVLDDDDVEQMPLKGAVDDSPAVSPAKPETAGPATGAATGALGSSSLALDLVEMMRSSPVFGRESFGFQEIMAHAQAITLHPETLADSPSKAAAPAHEVDYFKRKSVFNAAPIVITPETAISEYEVKLQSNKYRNSVDLLVAKCLQAASVTAQKREHRNMLFIRLIEISDFQCRNVPSSAKLYFSVSIGLGDQRQYSTSFVKAGRVALNDTFKIVSNATDESSLVRITLFAKHVQPTGFKGMLRRQFGGGSASSSSSSSAPSADADTEIASFTIPRLTELAQNTPIDNQFVLCASTPEPVRGMAAVQYYYHTDRMAVWTPQSYEDCLRLQKEREYENQHKVFWEGEVQHSATMQHWKRRFAKVRNGKMYTYDFVSMEPLEEIDFDGYVSTTLMTIEECGVHHSFKVTFNQGAQFHYFFTDTHVQMQACSAAVNRMMASIMEKQRGAENTPPVGTWRVRERDRLLRSGSIKLGAAASPSSSSLRGSPLAFGSR